MICWGIDYNLTRNISSINPLQITRIKGLVSGLVSLTVAYILGMDIAWNLTIVYALLLGSFSYSISLVFFINALERLGSFRAGMFFCLAPFIGALMSLVLLQEWIGWVMFPAIMLTVAGVWLISTEEHEHLHLHQEGIHEHSHNHNDNHHNHKHTEMVRKTRTHDHLHPEENHAHAHWPDTHHSHDHQLFPGSNRRRHSKPSSPI